MINNMDHARVVSDKKLKGSGLKRGDIVLVTGDKFAPVTKADPYLQRKYVYAVLVKDGVHLTPSQENDNKIYLIDPRNLEKVSEDEKRELNDSLTLQFGN